MKKVFSKIKLTTIMLFASLASLISKALWSNGFDKDVSFGKSLYWVPGVPVREVLDPQPSFLSVFSSMIFKWVEFVLVALVFIIWIISYFKIRKIEDKTLKTRKIKKTAIVIWIILIIAVLLLIFDWLYNIGMLDWIIG